jgi:hypothetical protein
MDATMQGETTLLLGVQMHPKNIKIYRFIQNFTIYTLLQ